MVARHLLPRVALLLALGALTAACATVDSVKDARGQGVKRTFRQPYDAVFDAALAAAAQRKLELVGQQRGEGRILLSSHPSLGSMGGERIAVFVTRVNDSSTTVEVVAKPVVAAVSFPPDWPAVIFGDIEYELAKRRMPRQP